MPGPWNASTERKLLLCMIDSKASSPQWQQVSQLMGPQFTAEACRQKYYKLQKEAREQYKDKDKSSQAPKTPTKRRASPDEDETKTPPSKRARKPKREPLDGVLFSDTSNSPTEVKAEDVATSEVKPMPNYQLPFGASFSDVSTRSTEVKPEDTATNGVNPFLSYQSSLMPTDYFLAVNSRSGKATNPASFLG